jgi:hypothetical protein
MIMAVGLFAGCGTAEYEKLVLARAEELRFGPSLESVQWQPLTSSQGLIVDWPFLTDLTYEQNGQVSMQKASSTAGGVALQVIFSADATTKIQDLADRQVTQLKQQGYKLSNRQEGTQRDFSYVELRLENSDGSSKTSMRIYQAGEGITCTLSASGANLDAPQIAQFLGSLRRG